MGFLEAERVEDLELHNAVSSDYDHSHLLVGGGRVCCLIQHQVHERVVTSQYTLGEKRREGETATTAGSHPARNAERVGQSVAIPLVLVRTTSSNICAKEDTR